MTVVCFQVLGQKQAAEADVQSKSREIYERCAHLEADAEQSKSELRLENERLAGRLGLVEGERRGLQEEVDKLGSAMQSLQERLMQVCALSVCPSVFAFLQDRRLMREPRQTLRIFG